MDLADAASRFRTAVSYCDDVITVHKRSGTGQRGRRNEETALNRAVIVMAVAAWQASVENMVLTGLDRAQAHAAGNPPITLASYIGTVRGSVQRFSTANSTQSRILLRAIGYDPALEWAAYAVPGRQAQGTLEQQLDDWLRIRHAIAHADNALPAVNALQHVRQHAAKQIAAGVSAANVAFPAKPGLRLVDADSCVRFVRRITQVTGNGISKHYGVPPVSWK